MNSSEKELSLEEIFDLLPKEFKTYGELGVLFRNDGWIIGYNLQNFECYGNLWFYKKQFETFKDTALRLLKDIEKKSK